MQGAIYEEYYTIHDYDKWEGDWELIFGMPYAMAPSPIFDHQYIITKISRVLDEELEECPECFPLVEIDWQISDDTVVRPDLLVACKREERIKTTPKLIIEVVSNSSIKRDEKMKFELYEQEGVEYYSLVYTDSKRIKLYQLIDSNYKKLADCIEDGEFELEIDGCKIEFDTKKLWKKF